jgi:flagellum-specific peptidoglycan hydrolase FlgJ
MEMLHHRCRRVRMLAAAGLMAMTLAGLPEWSALNQAQVTFAAAAENQKTSKKTTRKKKSVKKKTKTSKNNKKKNTGKSTKAKSSKKSSKKTVTKKKAASTKKTAAKKTAAVRQGFVKVGSRWYYYGEDHRMMTGWIHIGGRKYYGRTSGSRKGSLLTGWQTIGGKEYYFSETGGAGAIGRAYAGCTKKVNGISCVFDQEGVFIRCRYAGGTGSFVSRVGEMARHNQRKNNILATVTVAQAILETGYGSVKPHNNLFGIYGGRYSSEAESMEGYNAYIRKYFPSLIGCRNYYTYASRIGNGGYAQAGGYTSALLQIISQNGLTKYAK